MYAVNHKILQNHIEREKKRVHVMIDPYLLSSNEQMNTKNTFSVHGKSDYPVWHDHDNSKSD